jgi:hypothetical protein
MTGRRLVRSGDTFTSSELDNDEIELELPDPSPEIPEDEQAEPWGTWKNDPSFADRLNAYYEFLDQIEDYG